ncbi:MAG: hypoxanthine phosphoribosyltransferase [Lachnospiraceae bacterium]|jgi:hypoxanthine phosphoribosyltransferase|nr:hypoxanthine phosphoribosyltransferase [Lachnospiraceae bacterium]MBR2754647.1 hypoxanthine phosphoribosyltransferase [Lachnospiraceae bacterium]MBR2843158.1 hypoxanthine phosphoribosyltransferase [Lachnospiraceae bacterium]MBR3361903.1 hypoxanthine phosphoribosyltransferase [Lachnospiraceae bacterium]MBR6356723.1 hypoxanthine phosphoribosyltransferase [Lachnospiraceae bacterium]
MNTKIDVLIPEEDIRKRISEMAAELSEKYKGEEVLLVGILTGSVFFLAELAQKMTIPVEIDFMAASSYGSGTESSGRVLITKDLARSIEGDHVIIVEDIVDTGQTLHLLTEMLIERNPASLELAVLLNKPSRRKVCLDADYVGFDIPDAFVVGWGLDYDQKYRDLPYIGVIKE